MAARILLHVTASKGLIDDIANVFLPARTICMFALDGGGLSVTSIYRARWFVVHRCKSTFYSTIEPSCSYCAHSNRLWWGKMVASCFVWFAFSVCLEHVMLRRVAPLHLSSRAFFIIVIVCTRASIVAILCIDG